MILAPYVEMAQSDSRWVEMASFRIDLDNLCLWRNSGAGPDERLNLPPKTFDVLRYLVENTGRLVTHAELLTALWPDVHVQPEILKSHILAIRTALGDDSSSPKFIETQRGRGYRFIGQIAGLAPPDAKPEAALDLGVFAGRAEPMRDLLALYEQMSSGQLCVVFISGEPGIGKTTLVEQFLVRVRGSAGLVEAQGHCIEGFAGVEPYYPIFEVLRKLFNAADRRRVIRALREFAPSWASQIPDQISTGQRTALHEPALPDARTRMVREACDLFEAIATEHPLVLVLEDLHWADFATIDFISALCRRRSPARLMLIGTYRLEDLKIARHPLKQMTQDLAVHKYCSEIELTPLSATAVAEILADDREDKLVSQEFIQFISDRTEGNPLFMRLTLDYLLERGDASRTPHGWRLLAPHAKLSSEAPPSLTRLIAAKIEGMTDEQRRVLEVASVAGLRFDPATTMRAADMDEQSFEAVCEDFVRNTSIVHREELLILPRGGLARCYAFNHAVYRQVLYDGIGQSRRSFLHRVIADRLEEIYPPDQRGDLATRLAQHFASAREWPRALIYLRSALRVATIRYARRDALAILDLASELAANLSETDRTSAQIEFLERRASIQAATHDAKARETYTQLAAKAGQHGDIDTQCRALIGLAYVVGWHDLGHSLEVLNQVLALCEKQSDPIQQDVVRMSAYARLLWGVGWNRTYARECEEAFTRLRNDSDRLTAARAQMSFGMVCLVSTRYREAHDLVGGSYRLLCESPENVVGIDLAQAAWMRHIGRPWALFSLGQFGDSLTEFDASIAAFESVDDPSAARAFQVYRGVMLFHAMDFEGVLRDCKPIAARPSSDNTASPIRILPVDRRIALIFSGLAELGLGNNLAALDDFRTAEGEMERRPAHLDWYWRLALEWGMVGVLITEGGHVAARARAKLLCDLAERTDERTWQALAWEARARAALSRGDSAEAIEHVAKALAACEGVQVPIAEWRVHATSAIIYKAVGDHRRARQHSQLGAAVRKRLADSLPKDHPVRLKFEQRSGALAEV
ncbi:MAG: transcriptional regulator, putative ATPase, winged helix family [Rhodospirillales bacterium]|nr:transcriptional regulator, putative ATPase, winged helix family [Rhodospirillales bacterium]